MTHRLFIVGAGGFGREVHEYALDARLTWDGLPIWVQGFIDDNPEALLGHPLPTPILGGIASIEPGPQDLYVIGVGDPRLRKRLAVELAARGARFASIVHPTAHICREVTLGAGVVVGPLSYVGPGARLGNHVAVNPQVAVAHDVYAGDFAVFSPMSAANGGVVLGEGAFLGTHATVLPGCRVGDWAYVGAGALVNHDVPAASKVVGVPARVIGTVSSA
jgi:sugar O-acyltransferase (sialic acid O-acetyltransferase NeuD family)